MTDTDGQIARARLALAQLRYAIVDELGAHTTCAPNERDRCLRLLEALALDSATVRVAVELVVRFIDMSMAKPAEVDRVLHK